MYFRLFELQIFSISNSIFCAVRGEMQRANSSNYDSYQIEGRRDGNGRSIFIMNNKLWIYLLFLYLINKINRNTMIDCSNIDWFCSIDHYVGQDINYHTVNINKIILLPVTDSSTSTYNNNYILVVDVITRSKDASISLYITMTDLSHLVES